jgi:hypothetical protein
VWFPRRGLRADTPLVARVRSRFVGRASAPLFRRASATVAFLAVFATMFGVGSLNWMGAGAGAALLPTAAALWYVAQKRARTPMRGTAHVLETPQATRTGLCLIKVAISAPEISYRPMRATIRERDVPAGKWPYKGDVLPVDIDYYWRRVQVVWQSVHSRGDTTGTDDPFIGLNA